MEGAGETPRFLCGSLSSFALLAASPHLADTAARGTGRAGPRSTDASCRCSSQGEPHLQPPLSPRCRARACNCMQRMDVAGKTLPQRKPEPPRAKSGAAGPSWLSGPLVCVSRLHKTPLLTEVRGRLSGEHLSIGTISSSSLSTLYACELWVCSSPSSVSCRFYPLVSGLPILRRALPAREEILPFPPQRLLPLHWLV